jgi:hypothetical protein
MSEAMKAEFIKFLQCGAMPQGDTTTEQIFNSGWKAALSQQPAQPIDKSAHDENEWANAQAICDLPLVEEAIRALLLDQTGDNATMIVREVLRAMPAQPSCEPVAWLHTMDKTQGCPENSPEKWLTDSSENPFGEAGVDYYGTFPVAAVPLYSAPTGYEALRAENEQLKKQNSGKGFIGQTQEFLHDPDNGIYGDCQRAVMASLFCLPIADVPHFFKDGTAEAYWDSLQKFCNSRGFAYIEMGSVQFNAWAASFDVDVYHQISGQSPRGSDLSHAVVGKNGNVFFDPHPSRDGLVGDKSKWTYSFLVKL